MGKRVFLTGGGTAGHVTPNLALIPGLIKAGYRVEYVGSSGGIERLIEPLNIPYHAIAAGKLRRYFDWQNFTDVLRVIGGFIQAVGLMLRHRPNLLFSKGGFVATPVVWADRAKAGRKSSRPPASQARRGLSGSRKEMSPRPSTAVPLVTMESFAILVQLVFAEPVRHASIPAGGTGIPGSDARGPGRG